MFKRWLKRSLAFKITINNTGKNITNIKYKKSWLDRVEESFLFYFCIDVQQNKNLLCIGHLCRKKTFYDKDKAGFSLL